ncbi:23 kDa jasmonate-induced protein-like [Chenopodium quinoa]|uniref:23 kDa jasmonate-induced protein-like n=1 Tax=Chenopodium quinoa TaxID=63459 RepID=UPI000B770BE7|nr:23 kDa jasmonate-induced protein-like [Chenopodium quinoa]
MNPFGSPITDQTLKQMSKYRGKEITQEDRAREAMRLIHAEDKNISALEYVLGLKSDYGNGVCTLCLVYNGTGDTLEVVEKKDWLGYVYKENPPNSFQNGQWLAFLHAHPTAQAYGSEAARVYRGKNIKGEVRDYMIAWCTPWSTTQNSAYTEVREEGHFPQYWDYIKSSLLERANKITVDDTSDKNCASAVSIGGITSPEFIAILKHKFSPEPAKK